MYIKNIFVPELIQNMQRNIWEETTYTNINYFIKVLTKKEEGGGG